MKCRDCERLGHMTDKGMVKAIGGTAVENMAKAVNKNRHTYYCLATKHWRKIKPQNDFNGTEWPQWCPRREGKSNEQ